MTQRLLKDYCKHSGIQYRPVHDPSIMQPDSTYIELLKCLRLLDFSVLPKKHKKVRSRFIHFDCTIAWKMSVKYCIIYTTRFSISLRFKRAYSVEARGNHNHIRREVTPDSSLNASPLFSRASSVPLHIQQENRLWFYTDSYTAPCLRTYTRNMECLAGLQQFGPVFFNLSPSRASNMGKSIYSYRRIGSIFKNAVSAFII